MLQSGKTVSFNIIDCENSANVVFTNQTVEYSWFCNRVLRRNEIYVTHTKLQWARGRQQSCRHVFISGMNWKLSRVVFFCFYECLPRHKPLKPHCLKIVFIAVPNSSTFNQSSLLLFQSQPGLINR